MGILNSIEYDANNYMDSAFAPVLLANKQAVHKATWGHLAPAKNRTYRGYIVFSISAYGDMTMIDAEFKNLPDSPWIYDAMYEFVFEDRDLIHGAVYRFDGTFRNYKFDGTRTVLYSPKAQG